MGDAPIFRQSDVTNLEYVRHIVLNRLKSDPSWNYFDYNWDESKGGQFVRFENSGLRRHFIVLVQEIMWQLMIQGVITPGKDSSNLNLPWFRITDYGQEVLKTGRFIPHDQARYLDEIRRVCGININNVTLSYLEESLRCFNSGCHVASVLLLGIAAECVVLNLANIIASSLKSSEEKSIFGKKRTIKKKHRWVVEKYQSLSGNVRRDILPESLDLTLTSLYELIRRQRNTLGHPQDKIPNLNREQAFIFFRLFPGFIEDVELFAAYCQKNGL